jgi:ketosteroid isomerase-like protein
MTIDDAIADIRSVIHRINTAWVDGPPDDIVARIAPCFDANAVLYAPGFKIAATGAVAIAQGYEKFVRMATVHECTLGDLAIHVVGDCATAVCPWTIRYTLNGTTYTESGHDILVFRRAEAQWCVAWRTMVPASS